MAFFGFVESSPRKPLVDYSLDESCLSLTDYSVDVSYLPLVDYSIDETEDYSDTKNISSNVLDQALDILKSHLAAMNTMTTENVCCRRRRRVSLEEEEKNQQKRVSLVLELEQTEEEERKVKVIQGVAKTIKRCSSKLRLNTSVFRRPSSRRSAKVTSKSRISKRCFGFRIFKKMVAKRQTAYKYLVCCKSVE